MPTAKPKTAEAANKVSTSGAAERALKKAKGDARRATDILMDEARRDTELYTELMEPWLSQAAYAAIRQLCQRERKAIWTAPNYDRAGSGARVVDLAKGNAESLLNFRLPIDGLPRLGDATREEVAMAAEYYGSRAKDMGAKARWLTLICQSITGRKKVKSVLSDARLRELQDEAARDV
jgi:hypothetical protein